MPEQDTRTATEIGVDAPKNVVGVPVVTTPAADAPRAESRGVYIDGQTGRRRIVAAGDVVPEGWERESDAAIEDRAAATITSRDVPQAEPDASPRRGRGRAKPQEGDAE